MFMCQGYLVTDPRDEMVCEAPGADLERAARVQGALAPFDDTRRLAELFAALSDPARLRIVEAVAIDELCVCDIEAAVSMSQSSVSHHLRVLRAMRLVRYRRAGRRVFYALDDEHVRGLLMQGQAHASEGEAR